MEFRYFGQSSAPECKEMIFVEGLAMHNSPSL